MPITAERHQVGVHALGGLALSGAYPVQPVGNPPQQQAPTAG